MAKAKLHFSFRCSIIIRTEMNNIHFGTLRLCGRLFAAGCRLKELSTITVSFWLRMPLLQMCWLSVTERSVLCPLSSVRSCCRSISSLGRACCHPGGRVRMWSSRSYLRGYCLGAVAPLFLAAFHRFCGGEAGPGLTRGCLPGHFAAYGLETGPWALLPHSFSCHPPPSHVMSRLGVRVCLHILKCLYYFLEILDFISSESLVHS